MENKAKLIEAILSRDLTQIRKAAGVFNGKPILAYIKGDRLITYDPKGNPVIIDYPIHSIEDMLRFVTDYNIILFDNYTQLREFIERGEPIPKHEYDGVPVWLWTVVNNDVISFDG